MDASFPGRAARPPGIFYRQIPEPARAPLVAAIVNGDLRELTFPIKMDASLAPVTMSDADGARVYRRSSDLPVGNRLCIAFPGGRPHHRPFHFLGRLLLPRQWTPGARRRQNSSGWKKK